MGKSIFHVHAVDRSGKVVVEKRLSRHALARFMGELDSCLVGLEACDGAHHWVRMLRGMGHDARWMSPQLVRSYVKSNKNDLRDAEALCEAVCTGEVGRAAGLAALAPGAQSSGGSARQCISLTFLPNRNNELRSKLIHYPQRTALANQVRGFLLAYGIVVAKGLGHLRQCLPEVLEDTDHALSGLMREMLCELGEEIRRLDERVGRFDERMRQVSPPRRVSAWSAYRESGRKSRPRWWARWATARTLAVDANSRPGSVWRRANVPRARGAAGDQQARGRVSSLAAH